MASRLVCTANSERRRSCVEKCKGCNFLSADRRSSRSQKALKAITDRRLMSNVIPLNQFSLAGIDGGLSITGRSHRWPSMLMILLITFNLLDVLLTARALSLGVTEANPVMAGLINFSLPLGMLAKFIAVSAGAALLWKYRHLPLAARGMNILTFCYGAVVIYHVYFQLQTL